MTPTITLTGGNYGGWSLDTNDMSAISPSENSEGHFDAIGVVIADSNAIVDGHVYRIADGVFVSME